MPVTEKDIESNVDWVIEEARRQIDHQMTTAGEIDGRATALLGLLGGVTGLLGIFGDLNLETAPRMLSTLAAGVAGVLATALFAAVIWPRGGASYGAGVEGAVNLADGYSAVTFKRSQARSLRDAIIANRRYLADRQLLLKLGTTSFAVAVILVLAMVVTGVFEPATGGESS
jgi:hypothetical protein